MSILKAARLGHPMEIYANGFFARVIQHEWDHLRGKVYLDRMKDFRSLTHLLEYGRHWVKQSPENVE